MGKFYRRYNLPNMTEEEVENLNILKSSKEIKCIN